MGFFHSRSMTLRSMESMGHPRHTPGKFGHCSTKIQIDNQVVLKNHQSRVFFYIYLGWKSRSHCKYNPYEPSSSPMTFCWQSELVQWNGEVWHVYKSSHLAEVCFAAKLPTSLPAGLEEPAVVPALLALEHPPRCPGSVEGRPRGVKGQTTSWCAKYQYHIKW